MDSSHLHRKERIVLTTIDVIDEFGIHNVSTREVARREKISEAAIFRHFSKKNDLLHAVIDFFARYDDDIAASAFLQDDPVEAVSYYLVRYAEYYNNYPQMTAILQSFAVLACDPEFSDKITGIYFARLKVLEELVSRAQEAGRLPRWIATEQLVDLIWGFFQSVCLKWRFCGYKFSLKEYASATLQVLLDLFTNFHRRSVGKGYDKGFGYR